MKYSFEYHLPYEKMMKLINDETVEEFWIVFAFFSTEKVRQMLNALQRRRRKASVRFVVAASSINPLQEVVHDILNLERAIWFQFHLVEGPLMHSKVFAARINDRIEIYVGSANLTISASNSNIESGVFFESQDRQKTTEFLEELMSRCESVDSFSRLKDLAILSHFRSEILFLALEESKTRQAISIKSNRIKDLFSSDIDVVNGPKEEDVFNESSNSSFSFNLLRNEDRIAILKAESRLKDAIKSNIAIKLDGYGWVSSSWSIRNLIDDAFVRDVYDKYLAELDAIRKKFIRKDYRTALFREIESRILERASSHLIHEEEIKELITEIEKRFIANPSDRKSYYRKIENIYSKLNVPSESSSSNLIHLLNPYRIGSDEEGGGSSSDDNFEILNTDQVNLLVMCQLAIKLRSPPGKNSFPTPPSVWWFDLALDRRNIHSVYGFSKCSEYMVDTKKTLEKLKNDIQDGVDLRQCITRFCRITGFTLGVKYPSIDSCNLLAWLDDETEIFDHPYIFVKAQNENYSLYNIETVARDEHRVTMIHNDNGKFVHLFDLKEPPALTQMNKSVLKKKLILGTDLLLYFDKTCGISFLYYSQDA